MTLPRLELCAAKLAADLMKRIQQDLEIDRPNFHLWSDSTAVLGWIKAESSNYHTFIANRIAAIQRISNANQWHHVSSQNNPADIISRGEKPIELVDDWLWFYGPQFLHLLNSNWMHQDEAIPICNIEQRTKINLITTTNVTPDIFSSINHCNSFRKLQRIVAYCLRVAKPRLGECTLQGSANLAIRAEEMEYALRKIIQHIQRLSFHEDIRQLEKYKSVEHNSSLAHLNPFIDETGILRVGGRLEAASLSYEAKHPALLSHRHPLTKLLLTDLHKENMHAGVQTLISISRQQFWIVNAKTLARNIVHNCVLCVRARPKLTQQIMAHLPKDRVLATRPFLITGVDFFGPIYIHFKTRGKRPQKVYVSVFCCFSTKAIHMEIVSDLSTEAFLGALKRFIGRRGKCQKIYCDNATNFVGANNELSDVATIIHTEEAQTRIINHCSKANIEFCFIPPRAPHFGGLWEAAVKSAKGLLKATLASASLTYEEMETVIIEAEAILNSRPLTPMSSDPNDMAALTPGHFLVGEPLTALADPHTNPTKISYLSRWKLVTQLKAEFWRRWSNEYLQQLQQRYRWNTECPNLQPGAMVIIKDDNLPPLKWVLGRIENTICGPDGKVRVADVRTPHSILRRPIHKLALLPTDSETEHDIDSPMVNANPQVAGTARKRKSTSSLATLLLACLVLPFVSCSVTEITPFKGEPGIYYERVGMANIITSNWNLVNYFDMRLYWKEASTASKYASTVSQLCDFMSSKESCQNTVALINKRLAIIKKVDEMFHQNQQSNKLKT